MATPTISIAGRLVYAGWSAYVVSFRKALQGNVPVAAKVPFVSKKVSPRFP